MMMMSSHAPYVAIAINSGSLFLGPAWGDSVIIIIYLTKESDRHSQLANLLMPIA